MRKPPFEFLNHTADVYIAAHGKDLKEAFENAAKAMFQVMTDISTIKPKISRHVKVEGFDLESLLYNWLEELLYIFNVDLIVFSKFNVKKIEKIGEEKYVLEAIAYGEKFDPSRHPRKVEVKAVTYSLMEIIDKPGETTIKFVLDI
ncbi:MAG: archease [Candidatus Methanomethylicota archaeon]|uniref:Protein archease n=1 Tax=Thermoproteota archaeon TaxID=2056631 RepID=A0A497EWJ7_9CREN|nr:MAG: archease [Candidatus Verstraetearchaeota archaeon]